MMSVAIVCLGLRLVGSSADPGEDALLEALYSTRAETPEPTATPPRVSLQARGEISLQNAWNQTGAAPAAFDTRAIADLGAEARLGRFRLSGALFGNLARQRYSGQRILVPQEAKLSYEHGQTAATVGLIDANWSLMDGASLLDAWGRQDLSDPFNPRRLGTYAARVAYNQSNWSVELMAGVGDSAHRLPGGTRTGLDADEDLLVHPWVGIIERYLPEEQIVRAPNATDNRFAPQLGGRVVGSIGPIDLHLVGHWGPARLGRPTEELELDLLSAARRIRIVETRYRTGLAALGTAVVVGPLLFRSEWALLFDGQGRPETRGGAGGSVEHRWAMASGWSLLSLLQVHRLRADQVEWMTALRGTRPRSWLTGHFSLQAPGDDVAIVARQAVGLVDADLYLSPAFRFRLPWVSGLFASAGADLLWLQATAESDGATAHRLRINLDLSW